MIFDVELTQRADGHYIARALLIPDVIVEAASREAAVEQIRAALLIRRSSIELVRIDIGDVSETVPTGWPRHAGTFPDDDAYSEMLAEVERIRRALDQDAAA